MKLFHEWFGAWTETERQTLLEHLRKVDPEFMHQYEKRLKGEASQEEAIQTECAGDEGHNPPSSLSSPPSTLPRSHSPHDSGLDEPSTDTEHAEPQSLDSGHDKEDTTPTGHSAVEVSTSTVGKSETNVTACKNDDQEKDVFNMDDLANGLHDSQNITTVTVPGPDNMASPPACEAVAEH